MLHKLLLLLLLASTCSLASAKEDDAAPGLRLGAKAPNFKLSDQGNHKHDLTGLLKQGPVAVVFHRSADW